MIGNGLMGDLQHAAPLDGSLLQQKGRHPLVQALPHDLLHQPHDLGEPAGHQLVGVVGHRRRRLHDVLVDLRGNDPEVRVLLRLDGDLKLDGAHDAGRREQAQIPVEQAVNGDLPPLVREDIGPELPRLHQEESGAVHVPVVQDRPLLHGSEIQIAADPVLLVLPVPEIWQSWDMM